MSAGTGYAVAVGADDAALRDGFRHLMAAVSDMTPAMADIGLGLVLSTQQRFEAERDPAGRPWRPRSITTIVMRLGGERKTFTRKGDLRAKALRELARKILHLRGHLKGDITYRASADAVEVGSPTKYARVHQLGGRAGRGRKVTIPPRPFLGIDAGDRTMIIGTLQRHLASALDGRA